MIAIFNNENEARTYAEKIHNYLTNVRPRYNAKLWSEPEQSSDGLAWMVKAPPEHDDNRWGIPIHDAPELKAAIGQTIQLIEKSNVNKGQYYLYNGEVVLCKKSQQLNNFFLVDDINSFSFFRSKDELIEFELYHNAR